MARIDFSFQKKHNGKSPFVLETTGQVRSNSLIGIFGASGSGKTSFLRCLAGLSRPDKGVINFDNKIWYDSTKKISTAVQDRKVGFVFQEPSLFPNMTVKENIQFARSKSNSHTLSEDLHLLNLTHLLSKYPHELSGGERQRVALVRTIGNEPQLLLLDEPLSALDSENERLVIHYIKKIHQERQLCTFMVSHDAQKLAILADEVWKFEKGKIKKTYTAKDLQNELNTVDLFKEKGIILSIESKNDICKVGILYRDTLIYTQLNPSCYPNIKCGDLIQWSPLKANL